MTKSNGKPVWASKTIWVNSLTFLAGVAAVLVDVPLIAENPKATAAVTMVVLPLLNNLLRLVTSEPVSMQ